MKAPEDERLAQTDPDQHRGGPAARYRTFRRGLRSNSVLDLTWRIGVLTAGGMVVAAGVAMLALPGPGWATIFVGLMILASEFAWARRSLDWTRARAHDARMRATAPEVRRRNQVLVAVAALLLVAGTLWYWRTYSFPGPVGVWLMDVWQT